MADERKLTAAEKRRKGLFENRKKELEESGYQCKDLTINVINANVMAVLLMGPLCILVVILFFALNRTGHFTYSLSQSLLFLFLIIAFVPLHEGIHGLVWGTFAENHFRSIEFGVIWKMLTPYCTCLEPLSRPVYIIGAAMPTVILGLASAIPAIRNGSLWMLALSIMIILGGGGDACIILKLLQHREHGKKSIYVDHPYECGVVVFESPQSSPDNNSILS